MKKMIKFKKPGYSEAEETEYDYELGEIIRVNSNEVYKCIRIDEDKDTKIYVFKKGMVSYNFNW